MRLLRRRVSLLLLLADAEQADGRIRAAEHVLGVDCAEPGELHELARREQSTFAPESRNDDRLARRRKDRGDRGPRETGVQPSRTCRRGHLRAGVAGGDERVGLAVGLQA